MFVPTCTHSVFENHKHVDKSIWMYTGLCSLECQLLLILDFTLH